MQVLVPENWDDPGAELVRVEAVDRDAGENAVVRYSFADASGDASLDTGSSIVMASFRIDEQTGS